MNSKGTNSPRSFPSFCHFSLVAIETARTVASSVALVQSMRVVQPSAISYVSKEERYNAGSKLTLEVFIRKS